MKTSELTGIALDWAVAKCEYPNNTVEHFNRLRSEHVLHRRFYYSTNWAQGGPIIERERIQLWSSISSSDWGAANPSKNQCVHYIGPTPLIAAMRCFVASTLGDEVDVPEELT